ncbi:hypothetical protein MKX03_018328, partial [Papaver bracteatum]
AQANHAMGISSGLVTRGSRRAPIDAVDDEFDSDFNCEARVPASEGLYGVRRPLADPANAIMDDLLYKSN